jgi:hypothetical protein
MNKNQKTFCKGTIIFIIAIALFSAPMIQAWTPYEDINLRHWYNISNWNELNGTGNISTTGNISAFQGIFNFVDKIEISEPATPPSNILRLFVEDFKGFSFYKYLDDTGMKRQLVRDSVFVVKNVRGTTIAANRLVYATGSEDNVPTIDLADASNISKLPSIGVTLESMANGSFGRVMQIGLLENVNTNNFNEGDVLYVSASTPGTPTATPPLIPNLTQEIGTVLVKSTTAGQIQIISRALTGDELGTINNFLIQGNLSALGSNHSITGPLTITATNESAFVVEDDSNDDVFTIDTYNWIVSNFGDTNLTSGDILTTRFSENQIIFSSGTELTGSNNLIYNSSRVGINHPIAQPTTALDVRRGEGTGDQGDYVAKFYHSTPSLNIIAGGSWVGISADSTSNELFSIFDEYWSPGKTIRFHIKANGNIGIGPNVTNPAHLLTVEGNVSAHNYLNGSGVLEWIEPRHILDVDDEDVETDLNTYIDVAGDNFSGWINGTGNITTTGNMTADWLFGNINTSDIRSEHWVNETGDSMTGNLTMANSANISLGDNQQITFGDADDAQEFFDGTNFNISTDSGDILMTPRGGEVKIVEGDLIVDSGPVSYITGGDEGGADVIIKGSQPDTYAQLWILGAGGFEFQQHANQPAYFKDGGSTYLQMDKTAMNFLTDATTTNAFYLDGDTITTGNILYLTGTGLTLGNFINAGGKFLVHQAGNVTINDNDGTDNEIMLTVGDSNDLDNIIAWGRIGIGLANPASYLEVKGLVSPQLILHAVGQKGDSAIRFRAISDTGFDYSSMAQITADAGTGETDQKLMIQVNLANNTGLRNVTTFQHQRVDILGELNITGNLTSIKNITSVGGVINSSGFVFANSTHTVCTAENGLCNQTAPTKEFFVHASYGTGVQGATGDFPRWTIRGTTREMAYMTFFVPNDFTAITSAEVIYISGGNNIGFEITTDYGALGESYNTHSERTSGAIIGSGTNSIESLDFTGALSALAANDYVGVNVSDSGVLGNNDIIVLGAKVKYT